MIALTIAGWALIAAVGALGTVYQNRRAPVEHEHTGFECGAL